ncbi:SDR family NAD(P)-dependent oxidoreductase [Streptosporangium vulgare]|uniref:SDR family NAD(P)-dependent oxidoreductase n=1 Tax=Streptosporangium vulgare TaxID=46190 RepID=A0ABV5T9I8_9ACTN
MTDRRGGRHKPGGHSSTSGRIASANAGVYAATKFGVTAFSESPRQEVTTRGVRVVVVEPGFVATEPAGHNTDPTTRAAAQNMAASMIRERAVARC